MALMVAKNVAKAGLRGYGRLTAPIRETPDFVIVGAKRGGTTSLFSYLSEHPCVAPNFPRRLKVKGVHFFDAYYHRGVPWYRSHFPSAPYRRGLERRHSHRVLVGESTPYYLFHPHASRRAARTIPEAKIIVLLRNPVDRAFSHYRERVRHGVETLSFEEAVEREPERLSGELERILEDGRYRSFAHEHLSYLSQSSYLEPLRRWFGHYPRSQVLVLLSEDLYRDPAGTYARTLEFLGLPSYEPARFAAYNFVPSSPMKPGTRERLVRHFRAHNRRLARYLDIELSGWDC
jgi:Sulfotransferase domain